MSQFLLPGGDSGTLEIWDRLHTGLLHLFPELVCELGGAPEPMLAEAGLDADEIARGETGASYRKIVRLLEIAAARLGCTDFGMRLAERQSRDSMYRTFGPLGVVMKNSRTFGEAIDYVSRHSYAHSLAARMWLRHDPIERTVFSGHDILIGRIETKSQAVEQMLLAGHLAALEITGGLSRVRRVHVRHQALSPEKTYRRHFGCEVLFCQDEDGVLFHERDFAYPIRDRDADVFRAASAYVEAEFAHRAPLGIRTRGLIVHFLGTRHCRTERVAASLNLHPRTLHRQLAAEGTSFRRIKDEVRRDMAQYYLQQTDLELARISEKLGFAEQSVMSRRCHDWFAAAPSAVRARNRP